LRHRRPTRKLTVLNPPQSAREVTEVAPTPLKRLGRLAEALELRRIAGLIGRNHVVVACEHDGHARGQKLTAESDGTHSCQLVAPGYQPRPVSGWISGVR
jgi:hypothetical protein